MSNPLNKELLTVAQIDHLLASFRQMLLTNSVAEVYIQVVIKQDLGGIAVACSDSGSVRWRKQMMETLHQYLKTRVN